MQELNKKHAKIAVSSSKSRVQRYAHCSYTLTFIEIIYNKNRNCDVVKYRNVRQYLNNSFWAATIKIIKKIITTTINYNYIVISVDAEPS